jgi:hypothetical protein
MLKILGKWLHLTYPLEQFISCVSFLTEKGYSLFSSDVCQALNFAQDWFKNQLTSFEEIKSIATGPPKLDTSNVKNHYINCVATLKF